MDLKEIAHNFKKTYFTTIYIYKIEFYYAGGISYNRIGTTPLGTKPAKVESLGFSIV